MSFFRLLIISLLSLYVPLANSQEIGEFTKDATLIEVLGDMASDYTQFIDDDEILSWEIYVPENYDASKPAGIMVFAGSPNFVRPPVGWLSVMKDKNLIWVASRRSDNASSIFQKTLLAMMSVPLIENDYNIDRSRIYVTGEGRTASRAALDYPETFTGAIFMGSRLWEDNAEEKVKKALNNGFVFVTRELNAFPRGTRYAYRKFRSSGVEKLKLFFVQGRRRYNRLRFAESIDFLDG